MERSPSENLVMTWLTKKFVALGANRTSIIIFWRFADHAFQYIYLNNQPTWCTKFLFYNKFISCLYMFRAHVLIIWFITPIGVMNQRLCNAILTYSCDDTRGCVMQFWPPDDEHMCSKHVDAWNKLIVKQQFCASSWLITEINPLSCSQ